MDDKTAEPKKRKKKKWKQLMPDRRWTEGKDVSIMSPGKIGKSEGISIKRKGIDSEGNEYPKKGGYWISKNMNVGSWMNWLYLNIKDVFSSLWSKDIDFKPEKMEEKIKDLEKEIENKDKEQQFLKIELEGYKFLKENFKEKEKLIIRLPKKSKEYAEILKNFEEDHVKKSVNKNLFMEEDIKRFLEINRWLLGIDCEFCKKNVNIDQQTQLDLHVINNFGQNRIFEFKSPNLKPFFQIKEDPYKRLRASKELCEALDEIISYIKRTNLNSHIISQTGLKIIEPTGLIVIGYNLPLEEIDLLETWNSFLYPHIRIITYNSLIIKAKQELTLIQKVKDN